MTGEPDGPPTKSGLSLVDFCGGYVAALAILAGVWRARRDGRGADIDLSLFEMALAQLTYLGTWVASRGYQPRAPRELGAPVDGAVPELRDRRRLDRRRLPEAGALGAALRGDRARRSWLDDERLRDVRRPRRATATSCSPILEPALRVAHDGRVARAC